MCICISFLHAPVWLNKRDWQWCLIDPKIRVWVLCSLNWNHDFFPWVCEVLSRYLLRILLSRNVLANTLNGVQVKTWALIHDGPQYWIVMSFLGPCPPVLPMLPGGKESSPCVSPCPSPWPISCVRPDVIPASPQEWRAAETSKPTRRIYLFRSLSVLTLIFNWFFQLPLGMSKPVWPIPIRLSRVFSFLEQFLGPDKWKMTSPT